MVKSTPPPMTINSNSKMGIKDPDHNDFSCARKHLKLMRGVGEAEMRSYAKLFTRYR